MTHPTPDQNPDKPPSADQNPGDPPTADAPPGTGTGNADHPTATPPHAGPGTAHPTANADHAAATVPGTGPGTEYPAPDTTHPAAPTDHAAATPPGAAPGTGDPAPATGHPTGSTATPGTGTALTAGHPAPGATAVPPVHAAASSAPRPAGTAAAAPLGGILATGSGGTLTTASGGAASTGSGGAATPPHTTAGGTRTRPRDVWTRSRGFLLALAVLLVGGLALAALNSGARHGYLDPRSPDPYGSQAVAELLKARGVTTRVVTTAEAAADAAGPDTTLLVTDPDRLGQPQLRDIRSAIELSGGRTVLLAPSALSLPDLAPGTRTQGDGSPAPDTHLDPGSACTLPAATAAGRAATGGGYRYTTATPGAIGCYPSSGHPTLLVLPTGVPGGDTVLLGSETALLNKALAKEGNASLALQLLGSRPNLVWYMPSLADSDPDSAAGTGTGEEKNFLDLIPAGWSWALLQLFVAAAIAALWRARRLGPLVTERLPVLVRASEATEGRARLYRKAGARDRAATVLRAAARERLAALVGVPASQAHDPATLVPAVAARLTTGPPAGPHDPDTLLFGTTPTTDAALVALADHLDALEREVRSS